MVRFRHGASVLVVFVLVLAACGGGDDASDPSTGGSGASTDPASVTGTIRLLSYTDGFDPGYLEEFEKAYPNITLETSAMGSNEEAIAKLQAGFEADVVNSCVDEATLEMVQKGIYAPLDVSRLERWDDLFPSMTSLPGVQVDGQVYMLPIDAGTSGIVYDADVVTTPPDSWSDLFDPQWAGRAAIEDIAVTGDRVGAALPVPACPGGGRDRPGVLANASPPSHHPAAHRARAGRERDLRVAWCRSTTTRSARSRSGSSRTYRSGSIRTCRPRPHRRGERHLDGDLAGAGRVDLGGAHAAPLQERG